MESGWSIPKRGRNEDSLLDGSSWDSAFGGPLGVPGTMLEQRLVAMETCIKSLQADEKGLELVKWKREMEKRLTVNRRKA